MTPAELLHVQGLIRDLEAVGDCPAPIDGNGAARILRALVDDSQRLEARVRELESKDQRAEFAKAAMVGILPTTNTPDCDVARRALYLADNLLEKLSNPLKGNG